MADSVDPLTYRAAVLQMQSGSLARSPGLRLQIPNPFVSDDLYGEEEREMDTASKVAAPAAGRIAAVPALPQPPRYARHTVQDRCDFMLQYETYLAAINALQTQ